MSDSDDDSDRVTSVAAHSENNPAYGLSFGSTDHAVAHTAPDTFKHHIHTRGSPASPIYTIAQLQSASMAPLGFFAFGFITILSQGSSTAITEGGITALTYCFALGFGGLMQLISGMWEAALGNIYGAVVFSLYGGYWLSFALFGVLTSGGVLLAPGSAVPGPIPHGLQMLLSLWGILTFLFFICTLALNIALQLLLLMVTIIYFLQAAGGKHVLIERVAGWFGVVTGGFAMYVGFAGLFNAVNEHDIMPLGPMNWIALLMPKQIQREIHIVQESEPWTSAGSQGKVNKHAQAGTVSSGGHHHNVIKVRKQPPRQQVGVEDVRTEL